MGCTNSNSKKHSARDKTITKYLQSKQSSKESKNPKGSILLLPSFQLQQESTLPLTTQLLNHFCSDPKTKHKIPSNSYFSALNSQLSLLFPPLVVQIIEEYVNSFMSACEYQGYMQFPVDIPREFRPDDHFTIPFIQFYQKNERKKWTPLLQNKMFSVIFVVDLSLYHTTVYKNNTKTINY